MALSFTAQIQNFAERSEKFWLAVFKRAVELLADELQKGVQNGGRLPWDTGNMARSLAAAVNGSVNTSTANPPPAGDVGAKVALLSIGDAITLGYQAIYARRQNYGFVGQDSRGRNYNQQGAHFVEHAASLWPQMVRQAEAEMIALLSS